MSFPEMKPQSPEPIIPEFLAGGGDMGQRIREYDWSSTPLGPVQSWPQSLRTCIRIMLTSRQPIWIGWGKDLIKLYNDPYKAIVGGKHPWALGKPASTVWKDIWKDIAPLLKQVMEKDEGTYVESQLLIMERNGYPEETYYTFSYTPIPGDDGGTAGMICANTDDTDRIISERQLRTLSQLGKNLIDSRSNQEVIYKTISTLKQNPYDFPFALFRTISGNKAILAHTTELDKAASIISKEIDLDTESEIALTIKKAIATRKIQVFDNLIKKIGVLPSGAWEVAPDKTLVLPIVQPGVKEPYGILIIGLNPFRLLDEKYSSFFTLVADQIATSFNDIYALEEERKRVEALAEIDKAKTTFFSNISHEFRTPLTLLLGPIGEVMHAADTSPDSKRKMELAYRNTLRMQKLVNTLLEFSKIEAGRMEARFSRVDIGSFTKDLTSTFRSAIEKAGMQLEFYADRIEDEVYVDPEMWEKMVLNLVSNAFKYSHEGIIRVALVKEAKQINLSVSDTGIGIPEEELDKIFDRFHRVENISGRSQEGTGIGLSMVKELAKMHSGTITVASKFGKGSTFIVSIPTGKDHLPQDKIINTPYKAAATRQSTAFVQEAMKWLPEDMQGPANGTEEINTVNSYVHDSSRHTVLLADDNTDMREYVQRLLSEQFNVITAVDGHDAFAKMLQSRPDLLLTDVMMPKLDGFGLLKKVRSHPETKNIPVIFLSARAGEEAKVEGLDAGADDYLVKPFYAKELQARVDANIKIAKNRIAAENNLRGIIRQSPVAMILLRGPDLVVEMINEQGLELSGKRYEEVINRPALDAFTELRSQGLGKALASTYESGRPFIANEMPLRISRQGKEDTFFFNFTFQPLKNTEGGVEGIVSVGIDITEQVIARKKIEESEKKYRELTERLEHIVEERTEELRRSNDDLQQFAHVASHDLKEPVRKIKTFIGRLQDEFGDLLPEKGKQYVSKMQNASERMDDMIEGVLKYSSLNETEQTIDIVDLNKVITNIEEDLEVVIQQKNALIKKDKLPELKGAPVLIYQLFYNLIYNSLKFSKQGEQPIIAISSSELRKDDKPFTKITIADNGIGFDKEYAEVIFDTFTRLNSKDRYEGTGLGLALCKKIVERHHGTITASGSRGKGALFTILLPIIQ